MIASLRFKRSVRMGTALKRLSLVLSWIGCAVIVYFTLQLPRKVVDQRDTEDISDRISPTVNENHLSDSLSMVEPEQIEDGQSVESLDLKMTFPSTPLVNIELGDVIGNQNAARTSLEKAPTVKLEYEKVGAGLSGDISTISTAKHDIQLIGRDSDSAGGKDFPFQSLLEKLQSQGVIGDHSTTTELPERSSENETEDAISNYFRFEKEKCVKQDEKDNAARQQGNRDNEAGNSQGQAERSFCPCISPNLRGRLAIDQSSEFSLNDLYVTLHGDVMPGGEWHPAAGAGAEVPCRARTRLAVVIPYRDRMNHLKTFLSHMLPILKRQLTHFRIFVVEQNEPAMFNKAAMMNIGYLEAMKQFNFDCVMFHDVDILMEDDRSLLNCGDRPHHYAISVDRWKYRLKYETVFGAVVTMTPEMFNRTNGFSNAFFGWGGEDDDMSHRVRRIWKTVYRPPMVLGRYTAIQHKRDSANAVNKVRMKILARQQRKSKRDGLSSIKYTIKETKEKALFTWILADLNVKDLPYPKHPKTNYSDADHLTCNHDNGMTSPEYLSLVTCRYECDRMKSECVGFVHRDLEELKECRLLTSNCTSLEVTHRRSSFSYLKLPLTLPIIRPNTGARSKKMRP